MSVFWLVSFKVTLYTYSILQTTTLSPGTGETSGAILTRLALDDLAQDCSICSALAMEILVLHKAIDM